MEGQSLETVHRLKITLKTVRPPVWRRIEIDSGVTLAQLSDVLESAMGWLGGHLHAFEAAGLTYQAPPLFEGFGRRARDESKHRLNKVLASAGAKARWDYDFGDGWEHDVVVESIEPADPSVSYPRCVAGRRACPPDECGGPWRYEDLMQAITDPRHPQHQEFAEWLPPGFDAKHFEASEATAAMLAPWPLDGDW